MHECNNIINQSNDRLKVFCETTAFYCYMKNIESNLLGEARRIIVTKEATTIVSDGQTLEEIKRDNIPGDDNFVTFLMTQVSKKNVQIRLSIFQSGKMMEFQTMTSGTYRASAYNQIRYRDVDTATANILGVDFEVHFADRKENLAEVEWGPGAFHSSAIIPIPTKLTTTVRYY